MNVAVVVIGDEILSGHVRDGNTHFIAGRVAALGHRLARAVVVRDDPAAIASEIERERREGAQLIVTSGGLGSTHDDRTMEGVARALGRSLERCEPLATVIEGAIARARDAGFHDETVGAEAMRKMALAPAGAELLRCSVSFIPAVAVEDEGFSVVVLPGPPDQLARVFSEAVEPRYLDGTGVEVHRVEVTHRFQESTFAAVLTALQDRAPEVSIGSYPQRGHTLIRLAGARARVEDVERALREAIASTERSAEGRRFLSYLDDHRPGSS